MGDDFSDRDEALQFTNLREETSMVFPGGTMENSTVVASFTDELVDGQAINDLDYDALHEQYGYSLELIKQLRQRLIRRTNIIDEIRKYYLRDIVTMKLVIRDILTEAEREVVWKQYDAMLPSLDLRESLRLHAPYGFEFSIRPCELCGGQLELIKKDTDEVDKLKKMLRDCKDRENKWREKLAVLDSQVEQVTRDKAELLKSHTEEKRVVYAELKKLNENKLQLSGHNLQLQRSNQSLKQENEEMRLQSQENTITLNKLTLTEKELELTKTHLEDSVEQVKIAKNTEKMFQKEITTLNSQITSLNEEKEHMNQELVFAKQDGKQIEITMARIKETSKELERSLDLVNHEKFDLTKRLGELEEERRDMQSSQEIMSANYERTIDSLRQELRELQSKGNQMTPEQLAERSAMAAQLEVFKAAVGELQEINHNQGLELLDNAEEIQLFEQEIGAMQQFIRDRVAATLHPQTTAVTTMPHAINKDATDTLPQILKMFEDFEVVEVGDNDDANSLDDASVTSANTAEKMTIGKRRGLLKKQRTARQLASFKNKTNTHASIATKRKTSKDHGHGKDANRVQALTLENMHAHRTETPPLTSERIITNNNSHDGTSSVSDESESDLDDDEDDDEDAEHEEQEEEVEVIEDEHSMLLEDSRPHKKGSKPVRASKTTVKKVKAAKKEKPAMSAEEKEKKAEEKEKKKAAAKANKPPKSDKPPKKEKSTATTDKPDKAEKAEKKKASKKDKESKEKEGRKSASTDRHKRDTTPSQQHADDEGGVVVSRQPSTDPNHRHQSPASASTRRKDNAITPPSTHSRAQPRRVTTVAGSRRAKASSAAVASNSGTGTNSPIDPEIMALADASIDGQFLLHDEGSVSIENDVDEEMIQVMNMQSRSQSLDEEERMHKLESEQALARKLYGHRGQGLLIQEIHRVSTPSPIGTEDILHETIFEDQDEEDNFAQLPPKTDEELQQMIMQTKAGFDVELLLQENQPKVIFGVDNIKGELRQTQHLRRRSLPGNFNFHPLVLAAKDDGNEHEHEHHHTDSSAFVSLSRVDHSSSNSKPASREGGKRPPSTSSPKIKRNASKEEHVEADNDNNEGDDVNTNDSHGESKPLGERRKSALAMATAILKASKSEDHDDNEAGEDFDTNEENPPTPNKTKQAIENAKGRLQQIKSMFESSSNLLKAKKQISFKMNPADLSSSSPAGVNGNTLASTNSVNLAAAAEAAGLIPSSSGMQNARGPGGRGITRQKSITLKAAPTNASKMELALRDALLLALRSANAFTQNTAFNVINTLAPLIHQVCEMTNLTTQGLWQSLVFNRSGLDFFQKSLIIMQGIVSCAGEENVDSENIAEMCSKLVPLAGTTLNAIVTTQWQQACDISEDLLVDLTPVIVDYDTSERKAKSVEEFLDDHLTSSELQHLQQTLQLLPKYQQKIQKLVEAVDKMSSYGESLQPRLCEDMVEVLREWSHTKTTTVNLDTNIEEEREKVRKTYETKLAGVAKELTKMMAINERNATKIKELEAKNRELGKIEAEMKKREELLQQTDRKLQDTVARLADLTMEFNLTRALHDNQKEQIETLEETLTTVQAELTSTKAELQNAQHQSQSLDSNLRLTTAEKQSIQVNLDALQQAEFRRLNALHSIEIQYEPDNSTTSMQTEFLVPPMDLRTVMSNKLSRSALHRYPAVYSQSVDRLPEIVRSKTPQSRGREGGVGGSHVADTNNNSADNSFIGSGFALNSNASNDHPSNHTERKIPSRLSRVGSAMSADSLLSFNVAAFRPSPQAIGYQYASGRNSAMASLTMDGPYGEDGEEEDDPIMSSLVLQQDADTQHDAAESYGLGSSSRGKKQPQAGPAALQWMLPAGNFNNDFNDDNSSKASHQSRRSQQQLQVDMTASSSMMMMPIVSHFNLSNPSSPKASQAAIAVSLTGTSPPPAQRNAAAQAQAGGTGGRMSQRVTAANHEVVDGIVYRKQLTAKQMVQQQSVYRTEDKRRANNKTGNTAGDLLSLSIDASVHSLGNNSIGSKKKQVPRQPYLLDDGNNNSAIIAGNSLQPKLPQASSSSSLTKAGLSALGPPLNSDTLKRMQRELLSR